MFSLSSSLSFLDSDAIDWKTIIVGFTVGNFAFQRFLDYRQYQVLKRRSPPASLKAEISQQTFDKSQDYSRAKQRFGWVAHTFNLAVELVEIHFDVIQKYWSLGGWLMAKAAPILPSFMGGAITHSLFYLLASQVVRSVIDLPFDYYQNFVLEERYGFNKMTPGLFFADFAKTFALSSVIGGPLIAALLKIIARYGDNFIFYATGLFLFFSLFLQTIYPTVIAPLFNKFEPLEDGELKTAIEDLAKKQNFPLTKLYKVDGSKRSAHSNAYFVGLPWSKQIVLYDTLIDQSTVDEVVAVLAHEIGHWQLSHLPKLLAYSQAQLFFTFSLFNGFIHNKSLYHAFGFNTQPVIVGFSLFSYLFQPLSAVMTFASNLLSRKHEYEADGYARKCGYTDDLASSLIKITEENLSYVDAYWLYSAYHRSHPLLSERLNALGYVSQHKVGKGISPLKEKETKAE
ncbi:CAAX prenyl protease 1 [Diutina catenulata]